MKPSVVRLLLAVVSAVAVAACSPGAPAAPGAREPSASSASTAPQRTLVIALREEPPTVAAAHLVDFSGSLRRPAFLFNAMLDIRDGYNVARPYLAEALPQLNTDTWRLFPDGRMETTYRLKPNLTWHDGTPLTADDFVFTWRVYPTPAFGMRGTPPVGLVDEVVAPDARTVVFRWKQPYPEAISLERFGQPIPRHLLEQGFNSMEDPVAFTGSPFWTSQYVGTGPYRMTSWESGAFMTGQAFDGYVWGRPKIERIDLRIVPDPPAAMANIMADAVHFVSDPTFSVTEGQTLEQQWAQNRAGTVLYSPTALRSTLFQFRPEAVEHPAMLDVRVRRAILHGMDRVSAVEILTAGKGLFTDTLTSPKEPFYAEIDRVIQKYPPDARRAQQVMEGAGFAKGADGFFVGADGRRIRFQIASSEGNRNETEVAVFVDSLQRAGFDAYQRITSSREIRDPELRALLPGMQIRGGGREHPSYVTEQIPGPENRWFGDNRGGWSNAEYDRLTESFVRSLDQADQVRLLAGMERVLTTEVPLFPNYFDVYVTAHLNNLQGPIPRLVPGADNNPFLDVQTWEWRS